MNRPLPSSNPAVNPTPPGDFPVAPFERHSWPSKRTAELREQFGSMPPGLSHWPDKPEPFDPAKSQVIAWLMAHPAAGDILFNAANGAKAIIYDPATKTWKGRKHAMRGNNNAS